MWFDLRRYEMIPVFFLSLGAIYMMMEALFSVSRTRMVYLLRISPFLDGFKKNFSQVWYKKITIGFSFLWHYLQSTFLEHLFTGYKVIFIGSDN